MDDNAQSTIADQSNIANYSTLIFNNSGTIHACTDDHGTRKMKVILVKTTDYRICTNTLRASQYASNQPKLPVDPLIFGIQDKGLTFVRNNFFPKSQLKKFQF